MADKGFENLTGASSLFAADIFAIVNGAGNSRKITATRVRNFMTAVLSGQLSSHISNTEAHGISSYIATLLGSDNASEFLTTLGFVKSGTNSNGKFSFAGLCTITWREFTATTGSNTVNYGLDHEYDEIAVAVMRGDDSNDDVSTSLVSESLTSASVYSHASGSVSCKLLSFGV